MKTLRLCINALVTGLLIASLISCCSLYINMNFPRFHGVDPDVTSLVKEYKDMAKIYGIKFPKEVSVGFGNLKSPIIGVCQYGVNFREVTIDPRYWNRATKTSRSSLLFHELTHCYCSRDHDYGYGKKYPAASKDGARKNDKLNWVTIFLNDPEGWYDDGCPRSLMFPYILDDSCSWIHYGDYVKEMFNRCQPNW